MPTMPAAELKRRIPNVATVALDLYGIDFKKDVARCPFPQNHSHGDRDPSLRHDRRKNRLFCASQNCLGQKGVDAIGLVQRVDQCSFPKAIQKLVDHYGFENGRGRQPSPRHDATHRSDTPEGSNQNAQPIPAEAVRQALSRRGFRVAAEFSYGAFLRKVRFEHESAGQTDKDRATKEFRWAHRVNGIWFSGDGGMAKPLYVNRAFQQHDQVGLVVGFEGEAKADLAGEFSMAAFSFKNITVEQAATLADCDVVLWRDNDASGKGQADAAARVICAAEKARSIKLLTPLSDCRDTSHSNAVRISRSDDMLSPYSQGYCCRAARETEGALGQRRTPGSILACQLKIGRFCDEDGALRGPVLRGRRLTVQTC
jgi:hypothetical protein